MTLSGSAAAREAAAKAKTSKSITSDMANAEWNASDGEAIAADADAHLAHIDFENFRNEDLMQAYATFSPEEDSGTSVNEMSICKSEMLFSSINDSAGEATTDDSPLLRDSLSASNVEEENNNRCYEANKKHYTLAFRDSTIMANSSFYKHGNINQDNGCSMGGDVSEANLPDFNRINNNEIVASEISGNDTNNNIGNATTNPSAMNGEGAKAGPSITSAKTRSPQTTSNDASTNTRHGRRQYPNLDFLKFSNDKKFVEQVFKTGPPSKTNDDCEDVVVSSSLKQSLHDFDSLVKLLPPNLNVQVKQQSNENRVVREAWAPNSSTGNINPLKPPIVKKGNNCNNDTKFNNENQSTSEDGRSDAGKSFGRRESVTYVKIRRSRRKNNFPKSGSQNDLCDRILSGDEDDDSDRTSSQQCSESHVGVSAEYPVSVLGSSKASLGSKYGHLTDYSHKRALFMGVYRAIERLVTHQEDAHLSRLVFTADFVPALYSLMSDGLKSELITSFGPMRSSVWRVIEAVAQRSDVAVADLVMVINDKRFNSRSDIDDNEQEMRKLAAFVAGLLNMSCLHIWFSRLRWSVDVLLRFYERNALLCAQTRDTKLLHDELVFCLQRLFALPLLNQSPDLLTVVELDCYYSELNSSRRVSTPNADYNRRSRIPRPISLPKRLEHRFDSPCDDRASDRRSLSVRPSEARSKSKPRGGSMTSKSVESAKSDNSSGRQSSASAATAIGFNSNNSSRRLSLHRRGTKRGGLQTR